MNKYLSNLKEVRKYFTVKNYVPLVFSFLFLLFLINYCVLHVVSSVQFDALADSFIKGHLNILDSKQMYDSAEYGGLKYWPLGPLPAVILMPFKFLFSSYVVESYVSMIITIFTFFIIVRLGRKIGFSKKDAIFWALAFCTGTMYFFLALMPSSWYFAHVVTSLILFSAMYAFLGKRNYLMIGILVGLVIMTRLPAAIIGLFFVIRILSDGKPELKFKLKELLKLCLPVLICLFILGLYNFARFDNVFEQGYSLQTLANSQLRMARDNYGVLSVMHIPGNLYYMLISTPLPVFADNTSHVLRFPYITFNPWGISIFITSLWLFKIFTLRFKGELEYSGIFTVIITALLVLSYYGIGYWQIGYRYALDFIPLLFVIFMIAYKRQEDELSKNMKLLICLSFLLNTYLYVTHHLR